ncbi:uncharacterized protein LOC130749281 [Lotus japonicus]|uniref:uncharacterized protein LOC130749281 n=1 Tax=Lotus japonicus TaxID=34305 RepID=UPI0025889BB4|nr:uncharacterized protein LOC130749281 [Lotus japonicus]
MGTRFYTAPEILFDGPYSTPADLWSVGCIFGEMIIGNPIFETLYACQNELEAIFRVLGTPTEATWPGVSRFIDYPKYGKYDTMNLPMIFEAVGPDGLDLLTRMLTLDPDTRISAEAALGHAYFNGLD